MNVQDAVSQLRAMRHNEPFVPFVIVLEDGRRLPVSRRAQYGVQEWLGAVIDDEDRISRFKPSEVARDRDGATRPVTTSRQHRLGEIP